MSKRSKKELERDEAILLEAGHDARLLRFGPGHVTFSMRPGDSTALGKDAVRADEAEKQGDEDGKDSPPETPVPVTQAGPGNGLATGSGSTLDPNAKENPLPASVAILPVNRIVLFPHMLAPLTLEKETHKQIVDDVMKAERVLGVFTRKVAEEEGEENSPDRFDGIHPVGTVCSVLRMLRGLDGSIRLLVHGIQRVKITEQVQTLPYLKAKLQPIPDQEIDHEKDEEVGALRKTAMKLLTRMIEISSLSEELAVQANNIPEPGKLADLIASNIQLRPTELLEVLGEPNPKKRLKAVISLLNRELQILELGSRIQTQVKSEFDKNQRTYVLREQMKAIRAELGEEEPHLKELRELHERLAAKKMPDNVRRVANKELDRLEQMQPASAEYGVIRTYLEWFFDLPWDESSAEKMDLEFAQRVLDEDHYGLEKVKTRILEFLAVLRLRKSMKGPILCFVGPPGVGKTSLGRSIARATGRRFTRFSLGGMRDEAEIRGHRRTYIGAMPGRIIKALKECAANNPLIMLDEIDKLGSDFRGDPASALLEVLDPEQNYTFFDHYMDVPVDLSKVMFITTANQLEPVPGPLRDRMEVIELSGYTVPEKLAITKQYLVPRELEANGLRNSELKLPDRTLERLISEYTREAGVRNLQREIASICRKTARKVAETLGPVVEEPKPAVAISTKETAPAPQKHVYTESEEATMDAILDALDKVEAERRKAGKNGGGDDGSGTPKREPNKPAPHTLPDSFGRPVAPKGRARIPAISIKPTDLREWLGPPKVYPELAARSGIPGVAIGMAWTPVGGEILFIEASRHAGTGALKLTGQLGDVMKESAQAAVTYLHSQAARLGIPEDAFTKHDLHIHVPAGAVPKDGPSAGVAMATAIASLMLQKPVKDFLSMTGEITLRGSILPVGGIKEKCLAAQRAGVKTILLPRQNADAHAELPPDVKKAVRFEFLDTVDDALRHALSGAPIPGLVAAPDSAVTTKGKTPRKAVAKATTARKAVASPGSGGRRPVSGGR